MIDKNCTRPCSLSKQLLKIGKLNNREKSVAAYVVRPIYMIQGFSQGHREGWGNLRQAPNLLEPLNLRISLKWRKSPFRGILNALEYCSLVCFPRILSAALVSARPLWCPLAGLFRIEIIRNFPPIRSEWEVFTLIR